MQAGSLATGGGSADPLRISVGEREFVVRLKGPEAWLEVETASGEQTKLAPWRLDDHLEALDRYVDAGSGAVRFDATGFAREVLARSGVPARLVGELEPLALWWAVGGQAKPLENVREGWLDAGKARARLRRWTFVEREKALATSVLTHADGAKEFKLARYLRSMLEASVAELDPGPLDALDGSTAAVLLDAVAELNADGATEADRMVREPEGKELAATTLRICRALGWTPSQVWATPAAEIDRIVALLDAVEGPAVQQTATRAPAPRKPSLADYPDAVVIQVEDD